MRFVFLIRCTNKSQPFCSPHILTTRAEYHYEMEAKYETKIGISVQETANQQQTIEFFVLFRLLLQSTSRRLQNLGGCAIISRDGCCACFAVAVVVVVVVATIKPE